MAGYYDYLKYSAPDIFTQPAAQPRMPTDPSGELQVQPVSVQPSSVMEILQRMAQQNPMQLAQWLQRYPKTTGLLGV